MGNVSVTLLGGFSTAVDGVSVDPGAWRLRKARELIKLLALAPGHRLHREQVMDVLWRDRAPAAAANNLHQAVHVARRALGADAIDVREGMLTLTAESFTLRFNAPGNALVRIHSNPYWSVVGNAPACINSTAEGWTSVTSSGTGVVTVVSRWSLGGGSVSSPSDGGCLPPS